MAKRIGETTPEQRKRWMHCVLSVLSDRQPHTVKELRAAGGGDRIAARVWDLNHLYGYSVKGYSISGVWHYVLLAEPGELAVPTTPRGQGLLALEVPR